MARYAFSDLHGHLNLWKKIKEYVKPEDELYCLGDCGDRGPQSWETIKAILNDPQTTYIKGNHEHMLCGAMAARLQDIRQHQICSNYDEPMYGLLIKNNGAQTYKDWVTEGASSVYLDALDALPTCIILTREDGSLISLSHAGHHWWEDPRDVGAINLMWDREHYKQEFNAPERKHFYIVHGHTPCPIINPEWKAENGALYYEDGHKIDIDMGTYVTHQACLLNLDTLESIIIKED